MEQIAGPFYGFHLACYTVSTGDGFYGYAKICATRPQSVWQTGTAVRKLAAGPFPIAEEALQAVLAATKLKLADRAMRLKASARPIDSILQTLIPT